MEIFDWTDVNNCLHQTTLATFHMAVMTIHLLSRLLKVEEKVCVNNIIGDICLHFYYTTMKQTVNHLGEKEAGAFNKIGQDLSMM